METTTKFSRYEHGLADGYSGSAPGAEDEDYLDGYEDGLADRVEDERLNRLHRNI